MLLDELRPVALTLRLRLMVVVPLGGPYYEGEAVDPRFRPSSKFLNRLALQNENGRRSAMTNVNEVRKTGRNENSSP